MIKKKSNDLNSDVFKEKKSKIQKVNKKNLSVNKLTKEEVFTSESRKKDSEKYGKYDAYLQSVKEICDLALLNGDLRSAISAKKLEADWVKQNRGAKGKFGINFMSEEELESLVSELEESLKE